MLARPTSTISALRKPLSVPLSLSASASNPRHRSIHAGASRPNIAPPAPTPACPDTSTFLHLIGRSLAQKHGSKIPTWDALFSLTSEQLRELGVEPARDRRYLLHWREKFRKGEFGFGGSLKEVGTLPVQVSEGEASAEAGKAAKEEKPMRVAEVRIVEMQDESAVSRPRKVIVNVAPGSTATAEAVAARSAGMGVPRVRAQDIDPASVVRDLKIVNAHNIVGPYVRHIPGTGGSVARILFEEGLWEHSRGRVVDGGERRRAEVLSKRRAEERRTTRA
ncbi:MAG: hypothetical protein M4579_006400 [Chaenotheca gracillima]|nr:MAG: hypothetical protein M4579_006400 [Chaenotheca gracillima]